MRLSPRKSSFTESDTAGSPVGSAQTIRFARRLRRSSFVSSTIDCGQQVRRFSLTSSSRRFVSRCPSFSGSAVMLFFARDSTERLLRFSSCGGSDSRQLSCRSRRVRLEARGESMSISMRSGARLARRLWCSDRVRRGAMTSSSCRLPRLRLTGSSSNASIALKLRSRSCRQGRRKVASGHCCSRSLCVTWSACRLPRRSVMSS
mmetsp:Transcript_15480/g.60525  ORF Transcript_15480/g.60525 Transcript_15480/m.60525 type:complete len:204 (-) Transcript_15480:244-855(-)